MENPRFRVATLVAIPTCALVSVILIVVYKVLSKPGEWVADPGRAFPLDYSGGSVVGQSQGWIIPVIVGSLAVVNIAWCIYLYAEEVSFSEGEKSLAALLMIVSAIAAVVGIVAAKAEPSTESSFGRWTEERYGIEMEGYPTTTGTWLFDDGESRPDTGTDIMLDSGEIVRVKVVIDSSGQDAILIVKGDDPSADELPVRPEAAR